DSGDIDVTAGGDLLITAASLDLSGAPNGDAGTASFYASGNLVQTAKINANAMGSGGGGIIDLTAEHALTLGEIDVSGESPAGSGGSLTAEGWCSLTFPGPASRLIKADGTGGAPPLPRGGAPHPPRPLPHRRPRPPPGA